MKGIRKRIQRAFERRLTRENWHYAITLFNIIDAIRSPLALARSQRGLSQYQRNLEAIAHHASVYDNLPVPKAIHFVFGMRGVEELPYYAYLAIASAKAQNKDWTVYFHYHHEPTGPHWETIKNEVVCVPVPHFSFYRFARFRHYAHKADVVRLLALRHIGGVYLDLDTICCKPFEPLRSNAFVMGIQATIPGAVGGLCNAVMLSAPRSRFLRTWMARYSSFRSSGRDALWDFHSVRLPVRLAVRHPALIKVLPFNSFFYPLWPDIERVLLAEDSTKHWRYLQNAFVFHLWNGMTGSALEKITWDYVQRSTSVYAHIARSALELENESASGIDSCCDTQHGSLPPSHAAERPRTAIQAF